MGPREVLGGCGGFLTICSGGAVSGVVRAGASVGAGDGTQRETVAGRQAMAEVRKYAGGRCM